MYIPTGALQSQPHPNDTANPVNYLTGTGRKLCDHASYVITRAHSEDGVCPMGSMAWHGLHAWISVRCRGRLCITVCLPSTPSVFPDIDNPYLRFHNQNATLTFRQDDILVKNHTLIQGIHTRIQPSVYSVVGDKPQGPFFGFEAPDVYKRSNVVPFHAEGLPSVGAATRS